MLLLLELLLLLRDLDLERRRRGDILRDFDRNDFDILFDLLLLSEDTDLDFSSSVESSFVITGFDSLLKSKYTLISLLKTSRNGSLAFLLTFKIYIKYSNSTINVEKIVPQIVTQKHPSQFTISNGSASEDSS